MTKKEREAAKNCLILFGLFFFCVILAVLMDKGWKSTDAESVEAAPVSLTAARAADSYTVETVVTAYCPCERCCGRFSDGITASGHVIQSGDKFCAAPPEIPFNTMLDIPGYGVAEILDRGGAIKGNKLDVFFDSHQEALKWGIKRLKVRIYGFNSV